MNSHRLPLVLSLRSPWPARLADHLVRASSEALRRARGRTSAWARQRRIAQAEHEFARLDLRTLQDIGAPQGLVGQRRWQEEDRADEIARLLERRGG